MTPLQRWLSDLELADRSPRTRSAYAQCLRRLERWAGLPADAIDEREVRSFLSEMQREGASASWRKAHTAAFRGFYGALGRSEIAAIPLPKVPAPRTEVLSRGEVERLLDATPEPLFRALFAAMYGCGLRIGEAVRLRRVDVDPVHDVVHVRAGKGAKPRIVRLGQRLWEELRALERVRVGDGPWLFPGARRGGPVSPRRPR